MIREGQPHAISDEAARLQLAERIQDKNWAQSEVRDTEVPSPSCHQVVSVTNEIDIASQNRNFGGNPATDLPALLPL